MAFERTKETDFDVAGRLDRDEALDERVSDATESVKVAAEDHADAPTPRTRARLDAAVDALVESFRR